MFNFFKSNKSELSQISRSEYFVILSKIKEILKKANLDAQTQVILTLIKLLKLEKDKEFITKLNGVDVWGGSGAVWEVSIEDGQHAKEFEEEMIKLIDLMEETNVLGNGIKPIRKIFKENLNEL